MTKVRHKDVGYGQRPPFFHFFSFFQKEVDFGHIFCPFSQLSEADSSFWTRNLGNPEGQVEKLGKVEKSDRFPDSWRRFLRKWRRVRKSDVKSEKSTWKVENRPTFSNFPNFSTPGQESHRFSSSRIDFWLFRSSKLVFYKFIKVENPRLDFQLL